MILSFNIKCALFYSSVNFVLDANVDIAGPDDEEEEEFFEAEPLPILGRCKALYTFEGKFNTLFSISYHE